MKTVALKLNLAEDASEETILAEVTKLGEERDAAVTKLAEAEKASRDAATEATLAELIEGGHITPGNKATWLALAEAAPEQFAAMAEQAKTVKAIELGEKGSSDEGTEPTADPSVELTELATKRAEKDGITLDEALPIVLAENPNGIKERYHTFTMAGRKAD